MASTRVCCTRHLFGTRVKTAIPLRQALGFPQRAVSAAPPISYRPYVPHSLGVSRHLPPSDASPWGSVFRSQIRAFCVTAKVASVASSAPETSPETSPARPEQVRPEPSQASVKEGSKDDQSRTSSSVEEQGEQAMILLDERSRGYGNVFTLAGWFLFAFLVFPIAAAEYSVERHQRLSDNIKGWLSRFSPLPLSERMEEVWRRELADSSGRLYKDLTDRISFLSQDTQEYISQQALRSINWYVNLPTPQLAMVPIIAVNATVYLMWKVPVPGMRMFMLRNFSSITGHNRFFTLFTSALSHRGIFHFCFNQMALFSVGTYGLDSLSRQFNGEDVKWLSKGGLLRDGKVLPEVDSTMKLLAFFAGAALVSGLASWLVRRGGLIAMKGRFERAVRLGASEAPQLGALYKDAARSGSLGSSGVAVALFAVTALTHPEARIGIAGLGETFSTDSRTAMIALVFMDTLFLLLFFARGTSVGIDHAAHLAGAAFGLIWYQCGYYLWEYCRLVDPRKAANRWLGDLPVSTSQR